jgi:hypothetical protein
MINCVYVVVVFIPPSVKLLVVFSSLFQLDSKFHTSKVQPMAKL